MKYFKVFNTSQEYYEYMTSEDCITPNVSTLRDSSNTWINPDEHEVIHVTGVTISSTAETITKGETYTLTATVTPIDAFDKSVTWSSDDTSVATVSSEGVITAVGCGNATITVTTTDGGYTAQCATTVENPVTGVSLNTNVLTILTGLTYQLETTVSPSDACGDKSVSWSSSDNNIATVSNNGLVTAVASGSAVITVTTTVDSHTATCAVEVSEPTVAVTSITINENSLNIIVGNTSQLVATVLPNNATDKSVTWTSSNVNVATVDLNGVVSGVASGDAVITVTTVDGGYTAQCSVSVSEEHDYSKDYFTIESLETSNEIKIQKVSGTNFTIQFSLDNGVSWNNVTNTSAGATIATLNSGEKVILKGNVETYATAYNKYNHFIGSKSFKVYGNVMSLINGDNFTTNSEFSTSTTFNLCGLFYDSTNLIDAYNLVLPASSCTDSCYNGMFRGCTNLSVGPSILPATQAEHDCYSSMFEGCINLETAPEISLINMAQTCCMRMFCMNRNSMIMTPKMTKSPILSCKTTVIDCYKEMFKGNGNLAEVTCLKEDDVNACTDWLTNCSSTGIFYKSSLKNNWPRTTGGIPSGWTVENYTE